MSFYDKVRRQKFLSFSLILFTLAIGVLIGTVVQTGAKAAREQTAAPGATPLAIPAATPVPNEFTKIAKRLEPSVVHVMTDYIPKQTNAQNRQNPNFRRRQQPQDDDDDNNDDNGGMQQFFQRFFGGPGGNFQFPQPDEMPSSALGSGVVVDPNGYILTNNHVVEKATRIKVKFMNDNTEYPATVVGTDSETDIAVIHVDRHNLPAAKIGNSDALQVGDWVVAIGSPFGFQATVTAGIVSALSRDIPGELKSFQHFIQTDAAINPGNSGGPLLNINGEVVGINTMIASRSGGYQGIGFAMPINTVAKVYNDIIKEGHVTRGSIGIRFREQPNMTDLLKVYGADHGIFVEDVTSGGPAEKAGVKPEDIISEVNGHAIHKGQDLIDLIADTQVGQTVKLGIVRDKKPMTMNVVVGDRTKIFSANDLGGKPDNSNNDNSPNTTTLRFGMTVEPLRAQDKQRLGYKGEGSVIIRSVENGSFADDIGLAKGDIVLQLNRQTVSTPDDIRKIQSALKPGDAVAFHVMRQAPGPRGSDWVSVYPAGKVPEGVQ